MMQYVGKSVRAPLHLSGYAVHETLSQKKKVNSDRLLLPATSVTTLPTDLRQKNVIANIANNLATDMTFNRNVLKVCDR